MTDFGILATVSCELLAANPLAVGAAGVGQLLDPVSHDCQVAAHLPPWFRS